MRLIDADQLFLHLNDYALQEAPFFPQDSHDAYNAIINCMRAIDEAPTMEPLIVTDFNTRRLKVEFKETPHKSGYDWDKEQKT